LPEYVKRDAVKMILNGTIKNRQDLSE